MPWLSYLDSPGLATAKKRQDKRLACCLTTKSTTKHIHSHEHPVSFLPSKTNLIFNPFPMPLLYSRCKVNNFDLPNYPRSLRVPRRGERRPVRRIPLKAVAVVAMDNDDRLRGTRSFCTFCFSIRFFLTCFFFLQKQKFR